MNILVEFAHVHLDFHRAELESVLLMNNLVLGKDVIEIPLPTTFTPSLAVEEKQMKKTNYNFHRPFMILSIPRYVAEKKLDVDDDTGTIHQKNDIYVAQTPKKQTISYILSRCTLIRSAIELWGAGTSIDSCVESIQNMIQQEEGKNLWLKHQSKEKSWKITVHTLGTKYTREEQNKMRLNFSFLNFLGDVKMKNPHNEFILIRETELDLLGSPKYPRHGSNKTLIPENDKRPPLSWYFGRLLGGTRDWRGGGRIDQYNLKKRAYLGPTSMDAELSLIMTNLGMVKKGSFCFDPFVGTGSILLTCGLRGSYCFGTDIDIRILRGKSDNSNVTSNFRQYNLVRPDLVRSDNSIYHRHYRCHKPMFDAIICDPPYGIRAGARKSGSRLDQPRAVAEEYRYDHIAQTKPYCVSDVMVDLLDVAAKTLVMGGRLVYIIPSMIDFDVEMDLPRHGCLRLVHVCYQPLQIELGRRVITMEKVNAYNELDRERYMAHVWVNGSDSAEKCANIRDRLLEIAKSKPGYEEKAAYRKKKRRETKESKKSAKHKNHDNE